MTTSDFHKRLVDKYGADPDAEIDFPRGWRTLVETVFKMLHETDLEAALKVHQVKEKFGHLRIHLEYEGPHADRFFQYVAAAEDRALRICNRCGGPSHMRSDWPLKTTEVMCDTCLSAARVRDQLDRRRTEIVAAVRDWCAKSAAAGNWITTSDYALHRWRKDSEIKRESMNQAFRLVVSELDIMVTKNLKKQVSDFEVYQQLVDKIDIDEIIKRVS